MLISIGKSRLCVQICAPNIVHVLFSSGEKFDDSPSLIVSKTDWPNVSHEIFESGNSVTLKTSKLRVKIDRSSGRITFFDTKGKTLLSEKNRSLKSVGLPDKRPAWRTKQSFNLSRTEALYGLGQFQDGVMNWRGREVVLRQVNTKVAVPVLLSSAGWGLLWDNCSETIFKDDSNGMSFSSSAAMQIDYWFIAGGMDEAIAGLRQITGQAPLYGKWAYGYWQSKEHYHTQAELLEVADEFRRREIPIDNLVQDWQYWGDHARWNSMRWLKKRYPRSKQMINALHQRHFRLMASIWPNFGKKTEVYRQMARRGFLLCERHDKTKLYDASHPAARELYWKNLVVDLWKSGLDAWWMDACEPEVDHKIFKKLKMFQGSGARVQNAFPLQHVQGVFEHQRRASRRKRVYILARSGYAGMQRNAATVWSGDVSASWDIFSRQIAAGLNFCMTGIPYWTTDIGAFFADEGMDAGLGAYPGGNRNEDYRELYTRWFQFGAFCPIFRSHGTNIPREPWQFGEPGEKYYDTILAFDRLRYRLMPYLYSLAWRVTSEGFTIMRGLAMDFSKDRRVLGIKDQFMFGSELLVSPVVEPLDGIATGPLLEISAKPFPKNWQGQVRTEAAGIHHFFVRSSASARLWVNGVLLIDKPEASCPTLQRGAVALPAGAVIELRLEHSSSESKSPLKFKWRKPGKKIPRSKPGLRQMYLPKAKWFDFWTGKSTRGGRSIWAKAPLEIMPLYVRAGSILPLGPELQYSDEKPADPIELRVYTGANGSFKFYEDEGDGYDYEKGVYATIQIDWNDIKKDLIFSQRQGSFPGMLKKRTFRIVLVRPGRGIGGAVGKTDRTINYVGKKLTLNFRKKA